MTSNGQPYQLFDTFLVRTPLFSFDFYKDVFAGDAVSDEKLREILQMDVVREAIYVGSPQLYAEIDRWVVGDMRKAKSVRKFKVSIFKYLARMSTRCTPFGLFAGFVLGEFGKTSEVDLQHVHENKRHTRLDMNYLFALCNDIAKHEDIQKLLRYYPNSSAYAQGPQYRYVEYRYLKARRTHHMVGVDRSPYLEKIITRAEEGATIAELAQSIVEPDIPFEDASYFVGELIGCQLLVPELEPSITGDEFENELLKRLDSFAEQGVAVASKAATVLRSVKDDIEHIERSSLGVVTPESYQGIGDKLLELETSFDKKYLLQTDLLKSRNSATLSKRIGYSALRGLDALNRLTSHKMRTNLIAFKQAFYQRYEDREVSLADALDPETGLGYPIGINKSEFNPLVDSIRLPSTSTGVEDIKWPAVYKFLLAKYNREVAVEQKTEIEITSKELEQFNANWSDLSNTMTGVVSVLRNRTDEHPRELMHLDYVGGASASYLLGRFCHADEKVHELVQEIIAKEDELETEAITAEIVHLPEARTGNLLLRPSLRNYEIPYLARSGLDQENQIPLDDLMVSVSYGKLRLRSKKLNRWVKPRLGTAHNYSQRKSLPIYRFLCDVQFEGVRSGLVFDWGPMKDEFTFLPRVVFQNIVFAFAQWNIKATDIEDFALEKDKETLLSKVSNWRKKWKIPARVSLNEGGDHKLTINLDNYDCLIMWLATVKGLPSFTLEEFLFDTDEPVVTAEGKVFTNEVILSFYKNPPATS